ncbi:RNase adapter RapZ [Croceifilum oryzae]
MTMPSNELHLVVITGMSGAGKTVAVQSLEDLGYFCIDNLPPILLSKFAELLEQTNGGLQKVALVIDLRGREFFSALVESLEALKESKGVNYQILFLEANDETLVRRYKLTRRTHPLAPEGTVLDGILQERELLCDLRGRSHQIIDTSNLKPTELKEKIVHTYSEQHNSGLNLSFMSFGFKHGIPLDADLVFDVRFVPNPYYVESMRLLTGKQKEVADYVMKWEETNRFLNQLKEMLTFLLPKYEKEGKRQLVVGIGCTGGQHRSVAMAEALYEDFKENERCQVLHRDIEKGGF